MRVCVSARVRVHGRVRLRVYVRECGSVLKSAWERVRMRVRAPERVCLRVHGRVRLRVCERECGSDVLKSAWERVRIRVRARERVCLKSVRVRVRMHVGARESVFF